MNMENGDSLERWLRPLPFGAFLALALFTCFPQVFIGSEAFFFRDYGVIGYPNIHFQRECFWRGELPLWNPYSNCGQPFLAQWGTMTLYPFGLIYLLLPPPWSLSLFCFAHLWLGGMGMYLLARHWTKVSFAGALAGTIYVFNGIMFASFIWPNYLVALGWMPFIVLLADRAWREGGRWMVSTAVVATLQMLSGAPEIILFTWLVVSALWVCDAVRAPVSAFPFFRRMLMVVLLTSGLAAVQLLPFFELLRESHRDAGFATTKWQFPIWGWANFLVPFYNAIESPGGQYFQYLRDQDTQAFLSAVYLGAAAMALFLIGAFRWPDVRVWMLLLIGIVALLFSFGDQTPVFSAARKVLPLLGVARYPVKFLFLLAFIVPLLAGCGIAAAVRGKLPGAVVSAGFLTVLAVLVIAWAARGEHFVDYSAWPRNFHDNFNYTWNKAMQGRMLPDGITNTLQRLVISVGVIACLARALRFGKSAPAWAFAAFALIAVDARTHTPDQNPSLPAAAFLREAWPDDNPKPKLGSDRILITPQAEEFLAYVSSTNALRVWNLKRAAEWSSLNLIDDIAKVNGSSTLQTRRQRQVEQTLYGMTNRLPAGLLDFLGAAYVTDTNAVGQWSPRASRQQWVTAGQGIAFDDDERALATITNVSFNSTNTVVLSPDARAHFVQINPVPTQVSSVRVASHSVDAEVNAPQPTVMVIAQSFYPCWKATVDGAQVPLLRANVAFQAVPIPAAGQHRVRVIYTDAKLQVGAIISALSLLCGAIIWWRAGKPRSR